MPDIRPPVEPGGLGQLRETGLRAAAEPLPQLDDPAFAAAFDRFGDAKVVLLGEATHGTSEFYRARAAITRWLVEKRGFEIIALEADWPDVRSLDARVRGRKPPAGAAFSRFPQWMWRNREVETFLSDLAAHNARRRPGARAGLYGLDLYNLGASMRAVVDYLAKVDPDAARVARDRYGCLEPWAQDPARYGRASVTGRYAACETAVLDMLQDMLQRQLREPATDEDALLDATQSARLVRDAEAYYRAMYYGGSDAWNLRDTHMFETLKALLDSRGGNAKAVVWAHNSHVGDGRATEMSLRGELTLGQLCREEWGEEARLIGFGCDGGTVACASEWDAPMEIKTIRPSLPGSHERSSHETGLSRFLLDLRGGEGRNAGRPLAEAALERFIGAIYRPETERWSHYAECRLAEQFDAWVWFDETTAITPLAGGR